MIFIIKIMMFSIMLIALLAMLGLGWGIVIDIIDMCDSIKKVVKIVFILLAIVLPIFATSISISTEVTTNEESIAIIKAKSELILYSINNDELDSFDRSELIEQANEINTRIIGLQFEKKGWGGFLVPDEVYDLELIDFK